MAFTTPHTQADLLEQAARALAARDTEWLQQLEAHTEGWLEGRAEKDARRAMLQTMQEAAEMLYDQPSEMGWADDEDDDAA